MSDDKMPETSRLALIQKSVAYYISGKHGVLDLYECVCGNRKVIARASVKKGLSKSCGCLDIEKKAERMTKHGMFKSAEYIIWNGMINRCTQKKAVKYHNYGGRGIGVCEKWRNSFESFYADMGPRPSKNHSLDRIDNNGDYNFKNCRWATLHEQSRNKRTNVFYEHQGKKLCAADWEKITGVKKETIKSRLRRGWTVEDALKPFNSEAKTEGRRSKGADNE